MLGTSKRDTEKNAKPRADERRRGPGGEERRVAAWIGPSIVITGDVTSSEDMTIAGRVEGDVLVRDNTVVVAAGATIQGSIIARAAVIHGELNGDITADRTVEVGESGSVSGAIVAPRMVVAEGATLHGRLDIAAPSAGPRPAEATS